ncbi:hypothetical protein J6590_016285 [Homalodisca vitripennis]|nr:hypothetical protein J6590_016285 [Homalodisca vitripennis]
MGRYIAVRTLQGHDITNAKKRCPPDSECYPTDHYRSRVGSYHSHVQLASASVRQQDRQRGKQDIQLNVTITQFICKHWDLFPSVLKKRSLAELRADKSREEREGTAQNCLQH